MKLFNFFKKTEVKGKERAIESYQLLANKSEEKNAQTEDITTKLSLHESWNISQEQMYVFRFLANELQPLKPNQLSLSGIDMERDGDNNLLVKSFLRSTVTESVRLQEVELVLFDKEGKIAAAQKFDLEELGYLPPNTARPWVFVFDAANIKLEEGILEDGWSLAFNIESMREHMLDLEPSWKENLTKEQITMLEDLVKQMPELKDKEVNFTGFQVAFQDDGGLVASVFIRNGNTRAMNVEQLPIEIVDAAGDIVAKGSFELPPLEVKANSTKPWTFIFPEQLVQKKDADFSRWVARIPSDAETNIQ